MKDPGAAIPAAGERSITPLKYEEIYDFLHECVLTDLPFYQEELNSETGVLELGCGTGRVLLPLFTAGIPLTGLDISDEMLNVLREKAHRLALPREPEVHLGDMRNFDLGELFSTVIIPFNTFLCLETFEDRSLCLSSIHRHLGQHGRLIIDTANPLRILRTRGEGILYSDLVRIHAERHSLITLSSSYCLDDGMFHWNQFIEEIGPSGISKIFRRIRLHCMFPSEMVALARTHGFTETRILGTYQGEKASSDSSNLLYIFTKK